MQKKDFWCVNQCMLDTGEVACLDHLAEGRVFNCLYGSKEQFNEEYPAETYKCGYQYTQPLCISEPAKES